MQIFVNLTSHSITEVTSGQTFPTSGRVARVKANSVKIRTHGDCPLYGTTFGEISGLPDPIKDTVYIVSALCLNAVPSDRTDVVAPGNLQRDENDKPIGCVGFRIKEQ